jgi:hypothetical protein
MKTFLKGDTLENGAVILERSGDVVLCRFGTEYTTWRIDRTGFCHWGRYFRSIVEAAKNYETRISETPYI